MSAPRVDRIEVAAYTVPTEAPESDGTLAWDATTVVTVEASAGDTTGLGFTYGAGAAATLAREALAGMVTGGDPMNVPGLWEAMARRVRNLGRPGVASHAIAAVDVALWDLKAKLLGLPLARLLGQVREAVPVYGSGGFTSMGDRELVAQLAGWAGEGIGKVKMKIATGWGADPGRDLERVGLVREALGDTVELYVDANGGYTRKQALRVGDALEDLDVRWYEEPVSSDDLAGLAQVRDDCDPDVAAGEYGYRLADFRPLTGAVDCLQADVSRCAGITEWLRVAALAAAHNLDLSAHTAQSLHAHPAAAIPNLRHLEYFADHARTDRLLFDGVLPPTGGHLHPDPDRPGLGLDLKRPDAERWRSG